MKIYRFTKKDTESNGQEENTTAPPNPPNCFFSTTVNFFQSLNIFSQTLPKKIQQNY